MGIHLALQRKKHSIGFLRLFSIQLRRKINIFFQQEINSIHHRVQSFCDLTEFFFIHRLEFCLQITFSYFFHMHHHAIHKGIQASDYRKGKKENAK